eukprot:COSAG01_NODE_741_length_13888_cov_119.430996_15_plen_137_part_00
MQLGLNHQALEYFYSYGMCACYPRLGGLLVKSAQSLGNHVVRAAAGGLGKLCNVCWHRCMGVPAWREGVWRGGWDLSTARNGLGSVLPSKLVYAAGVVGLGRRGHQHKQHCARCDLSAAVACQLFCHLRGRRQHHW